jgi:hypothetical protein
MLNDSGCQRGSLWAMREPMCLLLRQPLDRVPPRCRLCLELLREGLRELRVSVPLCAVGLRTLTLRPIGRTVCYGVLGILLATQRAQRSAFLLVPSGGRGEVVRRQLPECEVESWSRQI